jgi:hypothetical protein
MTSLAISSRTVCFGIVSLFLPVILSAQAASPVAAPPQPAVETKSPWDFTSSITVKETYDDNVFLQDTTYLAHKRSMVTSATPSLALAFQQIPEFKASISYAPEVVYYHSHSSENHVAHRGALNLGGKVDNSAWEINNTFIGIDGSDIGPTFDIVNGGDTPAVGGIPLRDRRDALIYRNSSRFTQTFGKLFLRPVFTAYSHDFQTRQSAALGYVNYIDRYDVNGGLDIGYELWTKTWLVLGHRYGSQHQGMRLGTGSPYCSTYHRALAGIEGTPTNWLKLNVLAGPDFRNFSASNLPAAFDRNELLWWVDASATITIGKNDTITTLVTRYEQTAFTSQSVYEDILYSLTWRHKFSDKLATTVGMKMYEGDWQAPVTRDDVIYTPSIGVTYTFNKHLTADFAWSYDAVNSEVPNTTGREYTRNLVSLSAKYSF